MNGASFFGVAAEEADPHRDRRGPDTVNRLLLHGARYHDRDGVFLERETSRWEATPDWRADRHTVRIAIAMRERLGVGGGDVVALHLPLGVPLAVAERAAWGLGAVSLVIDPEAPRGFRDDVVGRARPVAVLEATAGGGGGTGVDELIDAGGALDTPERASTFRRRAREVAGSTPASLEASLDENGRLHLVERTQAGWASALRALAREHPPRRAVRGLVTRRPRFGVRALLHSGWADGVTRTAIARPDTPRDLVADLAPSLVVDDDAAGALLAGFASLAGIDG